MPAAPLQAKRFVVCGRVQGVGFRYFVRQQARAMGLAGWVKNLPDGRVEAFIEGPASGLEDMAQMLRQGPSHARVDRVDASDAAPGLASGFEIR